MLFFFSSRRRHTRWNCDWSSDVCSSDLDGWPGLKRAYDLPFATPRGLDHGLAYEAIAQHQVDAIDIYSTDAKIDKYGLTVLDDDRNYFPRYDAVLLYRADLPQRLPKTWAALKQLEGRIDDATMRKMN